jgi:iron(III) transport system substrate-binding protein
MFKLIRECWHVEELLILLVAMVFTGCSDPDPSVNIYCDVDSEVIAPLLDSFDRTHEDLDVNRSSDTGGKFNLPSRDMDLTWVAKYDLVWTSNLASIAAMERSGLLQSHGWGVPESVRNKCSSPHGYWAAVAADARVLIVNTNIITEISERPTRVSDLSDLKWKGTCAIANPLNGATATHLAALAAMDREGTGKWIIEVLGNAKVLPTDKLVASLVADGSLAWGLTDSNSAVIEKQSGAPVEIVFPDQGDNESGTLLVPNVVALCKNSMHPRNAATLADYLVSKETVSRITMASGAQFNVRPGDPFSKYFESADSIKWMDVDFAEIDTSWRELQQSILKVSAFNDLPSSEELN